MADKFYFFTDIDTINSQNINQRFGPVVNFENSKFELCSYNSSDSNPFAYAVCDGEVFVQEDIDDSNLVNLVLKPRASIAYPFPSIKYFVYRGLLKSSLIDSNGDQVAASSANDLTKLIWDSQKTRNENLDVSLGNPIGTTTDVPSKSALGVNYTSTASSPFTSLGSESIDKVFFNSASDFQLSMVKGGFHIGNFNSTNYGFQIILDSSSTEFTFDDIRSNDTILEVPELTGNATGQDFFYHWHLKELILNYVDPVGFFGNFYNEGVLSKESTEQSFTLKDGESIYIDLLGTFYNKNRVYLDIKGELNHSLNYQRNLGNDLLIAFDNSSSLNLLNYYRSNWPILILENDFVQNNNSSINSVRISLPKGNLNNGLVFLTAGKTIDSFPAFLEGVKRFKRVSYDSQSGFSDTEIELAIPNLSGGGTIPIASYIRLDYVSSNRSNNDLSMVIDQQKMIVSEYDHIFSLNDVEFDWSINSNKTQIRVFNEKFYVERTNRGISNFIANKGVSLDGNGDITFFAFSVEKHVGLAKETRPILISSGIYNQNLSGLQLLGKSAGFVSVSKQVFYDGAFIEVNMLQPLIKETSDLFPSITNYNLSEFFFLRFSQVEFTNLQSIASDPANEFISDYPISLKLSLVESKSTNEDFLTKQYEVILSGYKTDSNSDLIIQDVDTGIYIYKAVYSTNVNLISY